MGIVRWRTQSRWLRPGLLLMSAQAALVGGWALFAPRSFFQDFPILGGAWVSAFPPYNEHLVRDVGALYLGYALLFFWAASALETTLTRVSVGAWLPFAIAHFFWHMTHLDRLSMSEKILQSVALASLIIIPLALLRSTRRKRATGLGSFR
jgi:hypothetical protein